MSNDSQGPRSQRRITRDVTETVIVDAKPQGTSTRDRGLVTISDGPAAGRVISIGDRMVTTLGRSEDATICIDDGSLSREHARIARAAGIFVFVDAGSKNGSFVNGASASSPIQLKDGDRIQLGANTTLRFSLVDAKEEEAMKAVYESTLRDALTGVYNRRHLEHQLDVEISSALRHEKHLSVAMLDIDHFKKVNDGYGHAAGDAVLKTFAATLMRLVRPEDFLARYGGEEFTLVLRETDVQGAATLAERVRQAVEQMPITYGDQVIRITSSCGISTLAECPEPDKATLLRIADVRLYRAKEAGRNRVIAYG